MSVLHEIDPPWDQRLARHLIRPFAGTRLSPNHVTSISLASGLAAAVFYGLGGHWAHLGAVLFVFSVLADHADGELARMSQRTSRFGHYYDVVAGGGVALFPKGRSVDRELTDSVQKWHMRTEVFASRSDPSAKILRLTQLVEEGSGP